ncbi:HAD family hydrolase [Intrasporangium oryzae NRRL B-24470]|uniref:HAD family hydrolase n=1 Tax=Intrasporangium oryzae NRRL B-24470 TaxID=1386089 RepID=W9GFK9_9MICO|nr:HAD-IA family hydrolase [Intrasporangium oryzae]EWT02659.1 HAD family hydrolase [Intrasporangium oryzae NRRL B-24470]
MIETHPLPSPRPTWPVAVFDLDGTLADTIHLIVESYQYAFRTVLGQEEDPEVIRSWIGRPLIEAFREHSPEHADELYTTYLRWNTENTERLIRDYAGVRDVLADLRDAGALVAVATSKRRESARQAMDILGLTELVPVVVTMEDTTAHKPDPTPLLLALQRLGQSDPSRAVYVGDAVVDVLAGKAAGMATVAVTWGAGVAESLSAVRPDAVAKSADELRTVLLGG